MYLGQCIPVTHEFVFVMPSGFHASAQQTEYAGVLRGYPFDVVGFPGGHDDGKFRHLFGRHGILLSESDSTRLQRLYLCEAVGHRRTDRQVSEKGIVEDMHDNLLHNILFKIMEYLVKIPVSYFEICNYYIISYGKLCNIRRGDWISSDRTSKG